jgi:hypothetical protein
VQIAKWTGLDTSTISRFINEKSDLPTSKFLKIIRSMPLPFQKIYWTRFFEKEFLESDKTNCHWAERSPEESEQQAIK